MMIDGLELRRRIVKQLQSQRESPPSVYGDGLVRGMEIALEEIDAAIQRASTRSGGAS
jgi:hypothetical protein